MATSIPAPALRLQNKVALITGCAPRRSFGRAIARRLAQEGADVVLTDIAPQGIKVVSADEKQSGGTLEDAVAEIKSLGGRAISALVDVRSAEQIHVAVQRTVTELGRLDILVNNAAAPPGPDRVPMVELSEQAWDTVLDTNLKGPFLCTRIAASAMLKQGTGGRIINIASTAAKIPYRNMTAYCASKAGLLGLTRAMALELAPAGITVNAICPGASDTDRSDYWGLSTDGTYDGARRAEGIRTRASVIPLGRVALPEDIAAAVVFLASDDAAYLTGDAIDISGGYVMG